MTNRDKTILVVDTDIETAETIAELIEFMDTPSVTTTNPENFKRCVSERPLEAMFLGAGLTDSAIQDLLETLGSIDPNVPVVMLQNSVK